MGRQGIDLWWGVYEDCRSAHFIQVSEPTKMADGEHEESSDTVKTWSYDPETKEFFSSEVSASERNNVIRFFGSTAKGPCMIKDKLEHYEEQPSTKF